MRTATRLTKKQIQDVQRAFCDQTIAEEGYNKLAQFLGIIQTTLRGESREDIGLAARNAAQQVWGYPEAAEDLMSEMATASSRRISAHGSTRRAKELLHNRVAEPV